MYCVGREKRVKPGWGKRVEPSYYYVTSCAGTLRGTGGRGKRVKPRWEERNSRIYSTKSTQSAWSPRNAWIWSESNGILLLLIETESDSDDSQILLRSIRESKRVISAAVSIATLVWHDLEPNMQDKQFLDRAYGYGKSNSLFLVKFCYILPACLTKKSVIYVQNSSPERSDYTQ